MGALIGLGLLALLVYGVMKAADSWAAPRLIPSFT